jgi:hypothetical protein
VGWFRSDPPVVDFGLFCRFRFRECLTWPASGCGPQRAAKITHVSADGAEWIDAVVATRCPDAVRCMDPFHVVKWATDALDVVRRSVRPGLRPAG